MCVVQLSDTCEIDRTDELKLRKYCEHLFDFYSKHVCPPVSKKDVAAYLHDIIRHMSVHLAQIEHTSLAST